MTEVVEGQVIYLQLNATASRFFRVAERQRSPGTDSGTEGSASKRIPIGQINLDLTDWTDTHFRGPRHTSHKVMQEYSTMT